MYCKDSFTQTTWANKLKLIIKTYEMFMQVGNVNFHRLECHFWVRLRTFHLTLVHWSWYIWLEDLKSTCMELVLVLVKIEWWCQCSIFCSGFCCNDGNFGDVEETKGHAVCLLIWNGKKKSFLFPLNKLTGSHLISEAARITSSCLISICSLSDSQFIMNIVPENHNSSIAIIAKLLILVLILT